jgi:hypothetical protein
MIQKLLERFAVASLEPASSLSGTKKSRDTLLI